MVKIEAAEAEMFWRLVPEMLDPAFPMMQISRVFNVTSSGLCFQTSELPPDDIIQLFWQAE